MTKNGEQPWSASNKVGGVICQISIAKTPTPVLKNQAGILAAF
jgi:hypothetical protein